MRFRLGQRQLRSDYYLLPVLALSWVLFLGLVCRGYQQPTVLLSSTAAATFLTFVMLKYLGYFNTLRLFPRKSDGFLLLAAMLFAGLGVELSSRLFFNHYGFGWWEGLLALPLIAAVAFGISYYMPRGLQRVKRAKRRIILDTAPLEGATLIKEFSGLGLRDCVEYRNKDYLHRLLRVNQLEQVSAIIISRQSARHFKEDRALLRAHLAGVPILDYSTVLNDVTGRISLTHTDLWSFVMGARPQTLLLRSYSAAKCVGEPLLALILTVLLSPLLLLVALAVRRSDPGPVFYRQQRVGLQEKVFTLIKFRSMRADAETAGPQWSRNGDQRMTKVGRWLRATRMDELPQLWNVARGEMSFCGPRPERPEICAELKKQIPLFPLRTIVRPGITGWAQVCNGYAATVEDSRRKLEYDLYYIQNMSLRLDLIILIRTVAVAVFGSQALQVQKNFVRAKAAMFRAAAVSVPESGYWKSGSSNL